MCSAINCVGAFISTKFVEPHYLLNAQKFFNTIEK